MKTNSALTAAAALLLAPAAWGQSGATPPAAAPNKIGVLNVRMAIVSTAEGKQASAELQSQFAPRQSEMAALQKQIQEGQAKLNAGTGTDEEKARTSRQVEAWSRTYRRKEEEIREDLQTAENEIVDRIGRKMMEVVDRHAREQGYSVIFDVSAQTTPVIYASNQVDLTQEVIRMHDQANPVRSSIPAQPGQPRAQPAQPRPPAQKPPQP